MTCLPIDDISDERIDIVNRRVVRALPLQKEARGQERGRHTRELRLRVSQDMLQTRVSRIGNCDFVMVQSRAASNIAEKLWIVKSERKRRSRKNSKGRHALAVLWLSRRKVRVSLPHLLQDGFHLIHHPVHLPHGEVEGLRRRHIDPRLPEKIDGVVGAAS